MQIISYQDASKMPKEYMEKLVKPQIQCWGSTPHHEYKICSNEFCKRLLGILEIHGEEMSNEVWNTRSDSFKCPDCLSATEYVYEANHYLEEIREFFTSKVWALLVMDNSYEEILGFSINKLSTVESLVNYEFATRPGSYDKEKLLSEISQSIFGKEDASDEELIVLHHIYLDPSVRKKVSAYELLLKSLLESPGDYTDLPVALETRYDNRMYSVMRAVGFDDILADKYGYITQYAKNYGGLVDFFESHPEGFSSFSHISEPYKAETRDIIKSHPEYLAPYYYKK